MSKLEEAIATAAHALVADIEAAVGHVREEVHEHVDVPIVAAEHAVVEKVEAVKEDTSAIIQSLVFKCANGISRIDLRLHHATGEVRSIVLNGEHTVEKLITRIRDLVK